MTRAPRTGGLPPSDLGAVVHGPVELARSPGVVVGLRCAFGHPGGLDLLVALRATGVHVEAVRRQDLHGSWRWESTAPSPTSELSLIATLGGDRYELVAGRSTGSSNDEVLDLDARYWVDGLPRDSRLVLTTAWPQVGLAESTVALDLHDLDRVADLRVSLG